MSTEVLTGEKWIRSTLLLSAGLVALIGSRVVRYRDLSSRGAPTYPLVAVNWQDGHDEGVIGGRRICTSGNFIVRAVCEVPSEVEDEADAIAALIDAALENGSAAGVAVCERVAPFDRAYTANGRSFEERGGIYNLVLYQ